MKTKQQLREHLHTYAQIGVALGLLMGVIDLWGEDFQAQESALLEQVLTEELTAYEVFEQLSTMAEEASGNATPASGKTSKQSQTQPPATLSGINLAKLQSQNSEKEDRNEKLSPRRKLLELFWNKNCSVTYIFREKVFAF